MKITRVWFLALMVVALMRSEPFYAIENDVDEEIATPCVDAVEVDLYVPIHESREWFSFLDQETGTWRRD